MRRLPIAFALCVTGASPQAAAGQSAGQTAADRPPIRAELVDVRRIWEAAPHNAFTDLVRFRSAFYCAFREGRGHAGDVGSLRVLASDDGATWSSRALLSMPGLDLRDAALSVTPDGRLMVLGGAQSTTGGVRRTGTFVCFSRDGETYTEPRMVVAPGRWLWRVTWHEGRAFGVSYATPDGAPFSALLASDDGVGFEALQPELLGAGGRPTEARVRFAPDGTAWCLHRRDGRDNTAFLGSAEPPYTDWQWRDLGRRLGGPNFVAAPGGHWIAAGRLYDGRTRTELLWLDVERGALVPLLALPSGGDTSYPGMVFWRGELWVSYYASHEGKASIYLARVRILPAAPVRRPPNIITIFVDDMGWSDLSCFGGTRVVTENIDGLAAEGMRFSSFYVNSPICSPSRVALTTGQYPQRWRITSYLAHRRDNATRGMAQWLDPAAPVLARELQKAGYATGHFGKWHMGGQRDVDDAPEIPEYGFDDSLTNFEGMGRKLLPLTQEPGRREPGRIWQGAVRLGGPVTWMQRSEITRGFVDAALAFIERARRAGRPFFVNVWPDDVHSPFFPPLDRWDDDRRARYHGVLDAMDEQLAPLFERVRADEELRGNTVIVLCSDNGHEAGAGTSEPLRGAKTSLYEGGIRSPLIVWAPGLMAPDRVSSANDAAVFSAIDLNRALYSLAGIEPAVPLDGEDVAATLLGRSDAGRAAPLFWRRPPDRPGHGHGLREDNPDLAVRAGRFKYLVEYDGSAPQLYDLVADPSESTNLAAAEPDVTARLDAVLRAWNAALPRDAGDPAFDR